MTTFQPRAASSRAVEAPMPEEDPVTMATRLSLDILDPYTVATAAEGEPTAPGRRSGGAVSRNRLRLFARSQLASPVRYHISPRWMPFLNRQCSCSGIAACGRGLKMLVGMISTA